VRNRGVDAFLANAPGHGESVDIREHDVEHDEIGLDFFDDFDGFRAGGCGRDFEVSEMQGCHQQFADGRLVVNNNNRCFSRLAHASSMNREPVGFLNVF